MITEIPIKTELSTAYGGGNFRLETSFRDPGGNDGSRRPLNNEISEMSGEVLDGSGAPQCLGAGMVPRAACYRSWPRSP